MSHKSILDAIIEERLKFMKTAPERLKALEDLLEKGRLTPKQISAIHEEVARLRKTVRPQRGGRP